MGSRKSGTGARIPALTGAAARIAGLLRRGPATVDDLASELGVTSNAVRAHLARLERDGLVARVGSRPQVSRPAILYALTADAEPLVSRAYAPVLTQLLHVLSRELEPPAFDRLLRAVGRELMAERPVPEGDLRARADSATALLNDLGGIARVEPQGGSLFIRGFGCPLAAATREHPEACLAVESLLHAFVGAPVTSCCERDERMRCCFLVGGDAASDTERRPSTLRPRPS